MGPTTSTEEQEVAFMATDIAPLSDLTRGIEVHGIEHVSPHKRFHEFSQGQFSKRGDHARIRSARVRLVPLDADRYSNEYSEW